MSNLPFKVLHPNGEEWTYEEIEDHAYDHCKHVSFCDIEGFAINEDGDLLITDELGNFEYLNSEEFVVAINERTCCDISHDSLPVFQCSECGYFLTIRDDYDYTMWHGTFDALDMPRYCPNCGAKVEQK